MPLSITEIFGYPVADESLAARRQRASKECPFLLKPCWKTFRAGGIVHGTCTVKPPNGDEIVICPDRLYAREFRVIHDVALEAFGPHVKLTAPDQVAATHGKDNRVVAFGRRWGKELQVPKNVDSTGGYSADWILAHIDAKGRLREFVPVEVQTMDTTGSYQPEWHRLDGSRMPKGISPKGSGINWENVNKRIIPQLLTKGNVFGREPLCQKGLFFVCPTPVFERLMGRLGAKLSRWPMRSGALTFRHYSLAAQTGAGTIRSLHFDGQFTTTIENLKEAFNSTLNLPNMGSMGKIIQCALDDVAMPRVRKAKASG